MIVKEMMLAVAHLLPRIHEHPFNTELYRGVLSKEVFNAFLAQDKLYLRAFSAVLNKIALRLSDTEQKQIFYRLSEDAFRTQDNLHHKYLKCAGSNRLFYHHELMATKPISSVSTYIDYLHNTVDFEPIPQAVASCLPCFCIYSDLGLGMKRKGIDKSNPYSLWIESYSKQEFLKSKEVIVAVANQLSAQLDDVEKKKMIGAFVKSTHFEILFWDSVYRKKPNYQDNLSCNKF